MSSEEQKLETAPESTEVDGSRSSAPPPRFSEVTEPGGEEDSETHPTQPPEANLVLDLESAELPSAEQLGLEPEFGDLYQPFPKDEVTDEMEINLRRAGAAGVQLENEPTRRQKPPADETIALDEPDELIEDARQSPRPKPSAPQPPPPPEKSHRSFSLGAPMSNKRWWEQFFNDDYLRSVKPPTLEQVKKQCDFIEERLGLEQNASILDVGCGVGQHAVELASRGYAVVGLDISLPMLSRASDEAQDRSQRLNFLHADMRELSFECAFDAVLCWGTTFGYFDDEGNRQVIERLYRTLKPKGRMMLGVANRDFVIRTQPNVVWFEGEGCLCMEETKFDFISSRLEVKRTLLLDGGRQRESNYSLRLYTLHELGNLLHHQGFRVAEVSGGTSTPSVFFGADSSEMLVLAERRPATPFSTVEAPEEEPGWDDETVRPTVVDSAPDFDTDEDTRVQDDNEIDREPSREE